MRRAAVALLLAAAACSSADREGPGGTDADGARDAGAGDGTTHDAAGAAEGGVDAGSTPTGGDGGDDAGAGDAGDGGEAGDGCEVFGAPGDCIDVSACGALGDHTSYAGHCPGPTNVECCIVTPNVADNPPVPTGWVLMQQAQVTSDMTTWAVAILDDPVTYPMFSTTTKTFGTQLVLARVEWHPPDFNNSVVHRGVTLYVPA